jgi:glutathione S-transferase
MAIHPHGSVPALVDGDLKLIESSAIVMHLADKFPDKHLAPPLGSNERANYYRWMVYIPATVDPVVETLTIQTRFLPEAQRNADVLANAQRKWKHIAAVLESAVDGKQYIVGNSFTGADVVVTSAIGWLRFLGMLDEHPKLAAYAAHHSAREAFKRAHAD